MFEAAERPAGKSTATISRLLKNSAETPRDRVHSSGFTLLEILLALALIVMVIGATIEIMPRGATDLTPTDVFWKAVNEARKEALEKEQNVALSWDDKNKAFVVAPLLQSQADPNTVQAHVTASIDDSDTTSPDDSGDGAPAGESGGQSSNAPSSQTFSVPLASKLTVDFLPEQKSNNLILVGGDVLETNSIKFVTFYGDGTCTPFRAQFHSDGKARILEIDPWTCAEVLEQTKQ